MSSLPWLTLLTVGSAILGRVRGVEWSVKMLCILLFFCGFIEACWELNLKERGGKCPDLRLPKLNVDGAVQHSLGGVGLGAVIRDWQRVVCHESSMVSMIPSQQSYLQIAIREGLLLAKDFELTISIIESDCLNAIQAILDADGLSSDYLIVGDILSLLLLLLLRDGGSCNFISQMEIPSFIATLDSGT
ncbi:hypothetical protein TorRG33x02_029790 [Trema orientale]|uniref:RNase H type-1 domain-containing protein n=1 Tax=Trema orientale TaxID=63057 RepID=A0A2P5FTV5_TREOI|nr:hypothetical protein TorRG33x02_029790 [Trema orientale]